MNKVLREKAGKGYGTGKVEKPKESFKAKDATKAAAAKGKDATAVATAEKPKAEDKKDAKGAKK